MIECIKTTTVDQSALESNKLKSSQIKDKKTAQQDNIFSKKKNKR